MSANPYQDVAREFLDLWQKQVASVMGDKQFIHAMLELLKNMQAKAHDKPATTASNPADTSSSEHGVLAELAFRLAMCEKRIAALESKRPASRGTAKTNTRRGKKPSK